MVCVPEPIDILRCGPAEWSEILRRGARAWNAWRDDYPWIIPDLTGIAPPILREHFVARLFVGTARQRFAIVTEVFAFSAHDETVPTTTDSLAARLVVTALR